MDITLDRPQRDALHAACLLDLSGVDEIELYLREGDFEEARSITERIAGTASLLDALGWDPQTSDERFVLDGGDMRLRGVVERLRCQAEESLRDQAEWMTSDPAAGLRIPFEETQGSGREEFQRAVDEDLDTRLACDHILETLDRDLQALAWRATD